MLPWQRWQFLLVVGLCQALWCLCERSLLLCAMEPAQVTLHPPLKPQACLGGCMGGALSCFLLRIFRSLPVRMVITCETFSPKGARVKSRGRSFAGRWRAASGGLLSYAATREDHFFLVFLGGFDLENSEKPVFSAVASVIQPVKLKTIILSFFDSFCHRFGSHWPKVEFDALWALTKTS